MQISLSRRKRLQADMREAALPPLRANVSLDAYRLTGANNERQSTGSEGMNGREAARWARLFLKQVLVGVSESKTLREDSIVTRSGSGLVRMDPNLIPNLTSKFFKSSRARIWRERC
jgi:hypothetical protein